MSEKYKVRNHESAYFMTLTVTGWVDVFTRKNHRMAIVESLAYCQKHKGLEIYAWCLMSNHLHLLARANGPASLPEIIRDFKKHTAKTITIQINEEPESRREWMLKIFSEAADRIKRVKGYKFWQDGFQPKEIFGNSVIKQKLLYIHNNPVEEHLVEKPEDYLYSSARNYAEKDNVLQVTLAHEIIWA
jgi:putative transposase